MNRTTLAAVLLACTALATPASADSVTITSVTGKWTDVNPDGVASGLGTISIRWGNSTGFGQSGYDFISHVPPPQNLGVGATFDLADFRHINQPITGDTITQATLDVVIKFTSDLFNDGLAVHTANSQFKFNHNETPNDCNPQPGCANDIVTAVLNPNALNTTHFLIGTHDYVFGITGFQVGANAFASFSSPEGQINTAQLNASFNDAGTFAVPAPAVGAGVPGLVAACMTMLGFNYRRRRRLGVS